MDGKILFAKALPRQQAGLVAFDEKMAEEYIHFIMTFNSQVIDETEEVSSVFCNSAIMRPTNTGFLEERIEW